MNECLVFCTAGHKRVKLCSKLSIKLYCVRRRMVLCFIEFLSQSISALQSYHDDVIKWKHFPCYWLCVRWIHRSPVNSPHKGQWRRALMFPLIYAWINVWANTREAGDLRCHRAHYDVTVVARTSIFLWCWPKQIVEQIIKMLMIRYTMVFIVMSVIVIPPNICG